MLKAMWTSDAFYSDQAKARVVKTPVDFIVGAMKNFGLTSAKAANVGGSGSFPKAASDMGMSLFNPPNVAGWPGGMDWMNSGTLLARLSFAKSLAQAGTKYGGFDLSVIPGMPTSKTSDPNVVLNLVLNFLGLSSGALAITAQESGELQEVHHSRRTHSESYQLSMERRPHPRAHADRTRSPDSGIHAVLTFNLRTAAVSAASI